MKPVNIPALTKSIAEFSAERNWDQFHSVKNLTMALGVEVAELAEIFQWLSETQSNEAVHDEKLKAKIEDELADICVYLLRLFEKTGIDMENVVTQKMRKNAEKYPVHLAKGRSTKYSDLK